MNKSHRTIFKSIAITLICLLLLTACGREKETNSGQSSQLRTEGQSPLAGNNAEDMEMQVEKVDFFDVSPEFELGHFLGMQFYQGEPVQLWKSGAYLKDGDEEKVYDALYMYHQDGTRELCIEVERGVASIPNGIFFRGSDGGYYATVYNENGERIVTRLDSECNELYAVKAGNVSGICEMADGRVALLVYESDRMQDFNLALLDKEGKIETIEFSTPLPADTYVGTSEDGLLLMSGDYVYRVDLSDSSLEQLYSFRQYSYTAGVGRPLKAFCMRLDGSLDLLRADVRGSGNIETIKFEKQVTERKNVTLRCMQIESQFWLKEKIQKFNSTNEKYCVIIQAPEEWDDKDAFVTATGVEIATGKGPDILVGSSLIEAPGSLIEKGGLLDLAPLMKEAGIKEEDYYPLAFDQWRTGESIYSFTYSCFITEYLMSMDVLGDVKNPNIGDIVDAMLAYPEKAVYYDNSDYTAGKVLMELLKGSETLFGMVDWENGSCDFGGELFQKLLEVSKRYGYDERNNYSAMCVSGRSIIFNNCFYKFQTDEEVKKGGYVPITTLFDDGGHPWSQVFDFLTINANGTNKEGAWEFLKFIMSDEVQGEMGGSDLFVPVKRSAFWKMAEKNMQEDSEKKSSTAVFEGPLTRERVEELEAFIESARALPYRSEPILDIILEEAQDYFDGRKDIPQVVQVIENRVNLYLQEQVR